MSRQGRVMFSRMDEVVFGQPAAGAVAELAARRGAERVQVREPLRDRAARNAQLIGQPAWKHVRQRDCQRDRHVFGLAQRVGNGQ
jgi:hypothetical protein